MLLVRCFAVELYAYSIMSNHFHLVVRYDPRACERWTDEDVATRWVDAFPPTERGKPVPERKAEARELLLGDPERLARARRTLGSLSAFMKHLLIGPVILNALLLSNILFLRTLCPRTHLRSELFLRSELQQICNFPAFRYARYARGSACAFPESPCI